MKKKVFGRKLSRNSASRSALFRALTKSLILTGKIVTTKAKAKAFQPDVEKLVTIAKEGTLASTRRVYARLANDQESSDRMIKVIAPAMNDRPGGYTRIVPLPERRGDKAPMARIEWVKVIEMPAPETPAKKEKKQTDLKETSSEKKVSPKKKVVSKKKTEKAKE